MTQNDIQLLLTPMENESEKITNYINFLKEDEFQTYEIYTQYKENLYGQKKALQFCITVLLSKKLEIALYEAKKQIFK